MQKLECKDLGILVIFYFHAFNFLGKEAIECI